MRIIRRRTRSQQANKKQIPLKSSDLKPTRKISLPQNVSQKKNSANNKVISAKKSQLRSDVKGRRKQHTTSIPAHLTRNKNMAEDPQFQVQEFVDVETAHEEVVMDTSPLSPKKLKGSLSIKFKNYEWTKNMQKSHQQSLDLRENFAQAETSKVKVNPSPTVIVSQNNQTLQKCHDCLLYVPLENFTQHQNQDCESLHVVGEREYICSECLACYSSQKFLVRHKRECPKRNLNVAANQGHHVKNINRMEIDDMCSVVWKCHCKQTFTSTEELSKHRDSCINAQQYTSTCPICNSRMMGGSKTLRYHMSQHHAELFMPDEKSSSSMLSSLQGGSSVQVITTQTSNIQELVRQLSKEHGSANIRVVSVNPEQVKRQQMLKQQQIAQKRAAQAKQDSVMEEARQAAEAMLQMESEAVYDPNVVNQNEGLNQVIGQVHVIEPILDGEPIVKKIKMSPRGDPETHQQVDNGETGKNDQGDLQNLLVKAKALTKELEDKLAKQNQDDSLTDKRNRLPSSDSESELAMQHEDAEVQPVEKLELKTAAVKPARKPRKFVQVTCHDCKQVFNDYIELGRHKRTECHVVIAQHVIADGTYTEKINLTKDDDKRQQKLDVVECYYCTLCPTKFKLRSQVYEHMRFEHKNKGLGHYLNYHCPYCPRVFQTTRQRHAHKLERHGDIRVAPDDDFTIKETDVCKKCFQVVPKWDMVKHDATSCSLEVSSDESDLFCQLCGVLCDSSELLKMHRQVEHLNAIHFRCGQCSRTFGHAVELRCHKVSHHSKTPRWEHGFNSPTIVQQDSTSKNLKIHISPSVEEVKKPVKTTTSGAPVKVTGLQSGGTPKTSASQVKSAPSTPKSMSIRLPATGGMLDLTPKQMLSLSSGQPIKLVVPKNADMKNISFTVLGADGIPKKYSLTAKKQEGQKKLPEKTDEHETVKAESKDESPQEELAAALGLQPKEQLKPTAQHRPKRLRSGRTIDEQEENLTDKEEDKTESKAKVATKPATRNMRSSKEEEQTAETPQRIRTSARREAAVKNAEEKTSEKTSTKTPTKSPAKKVANLKPADEEAGETESEKKTRVSTRRSKEGLDLSPVQVLKPVGKNKVQCMRCHTVLQSMVQVTNHKCLTSS